MPQRNLLILMIGVVIGYVCFLCGEPNTFARYVARSLTQIHSGSLEHVPNQELFNAAMNGMVDVLHKHGDEHSQFISRDDADPFRAEMRQQFGGIGVRIHFQGNPPQLVIVGTPDPGTPAAGSQIRAGDHVLAIDDRPTGGMTMSDVLHAMRGDPGQSVRLTIEHVAGERPETVALVRDVIVVDSILGDRRTAEGGWEFRLAENPEIAQVRIAAFGNKTADELARVLTKLTHDGAQAAVLDLRDNPGGALDAAVAICDMFLPTGLAIVETRGRDGTVRARYTTSGKGQFQKLPLAVLVNQNSASASEIVAACLQDHHRAAIIGQRSYGKGTVQQLIPIESGQSLLKLTSASYWRPSGKNIHRRPDATDADDWGVSPDPDLEIALDDKAYEAYVKYRDDRDLFQPPAEKPMATPHEKPDADAFTDRPLHSAVDYLRDKFSIN
ncbi:MAG TPA: S41 family peptidase [Lacipirellulaceae bacterium]|jgi:carboxyl-terminal processing protease